MYFYYLRGTYTYLLSYLPPLLLLSIPLILSLFLITLTFLPFPSIPYMFNLICTNTLYIFNSITLMHHPSIFFYSSPPTKPSPILYLEITSRHHQFPLTISFLFSYLEIFKLTRFLIFRFFYLNLQVVKIWKIIFYLSSLQLDPIITRKPYYLSNLAPPRRGGGGRPICILFPGLTLTLGDKENSPEAIKGPLPHWISHYYSNVKFVIKLTTKKNHLI